jgi:hypothetical protein
MLSLRRTILLAAFWSTTALGAGDGQSTSFINLDVTLRAEKEAFLFGGPLGILVNFTNKTGDDLLCYLNYPNPSGLVFKPKDTPGEKRITVSESEVAPSVRMYPVKLPPRERYTFVVYLNRYLTFLAPGQYDVDWQWQVSLQKAGTNSEARTTVTQQKYQGTIAVTLEQGSDARLAEEIELVSRGLSSNERQRRREAVEALSFLDTPRVVPYLAQALKVPGLEIYALRGLGRFKTAESRTLIQSALESPEMGIVGTALGELAKQGVSISDDESRRLLSHKNSGIRYATLSYIDRMGDTNKIPLLESVTNDVDTAIAASAEKVIEHLKEMQRTH